MKRLLTIFMTLCMVLGLSGVSVWAVDEAEWQKETVMPTSREECAVVAVGFNIYIIGGESGSQAQNIVEIYNTKESKWTIGAPMPTARSFSGACVVAEKIYVIGGKTSSSYYNTVEIYDTKTNTWTTGAPMPTKRTHLTCATVGDKIYAIGSHNTVEIYDTKTNTWTTGAPMPTGRYALTSSVIGNDIYAIGGGIDSSVTGPTNTVEIYNTDTNTWRSGTEMPTKRRYLASCSVGKNIYVMGGYQGTEQNLVNTVEIYDSTTNSWKLGPSLIQNKKLDDNALVIDNKIYVVGNYGSLIESLNVENSNATYKKLSALLNVEETVQLSVSYNLSDNVGLTWSSTNEAVATVDANGRVTAVGEGQADIYAQNADGTFKEYISVKVVPGTANGMRLAAHLKVGEKVKLHLFDDPSKVTWKSMDESIATVSTTGQVTAAKKGLAIIHGELEGQTYQIYVRVNG